MTFRVELSDQAEQDGKEILKWLFAQHAGDAGIRWFRGMQKAIASLEAIPQRCPLAPENFRFPFEVRQLLYGRKAHVYRILFTIEGDTVHVLHIRRPGQELLEGSSD